MKKYWLQCILHLIYFFKGLNFLKEKIEALCFVNGLVSPASRTITFFFKFFLYEVEEEMIKLLLYFVPDMIPTWIWGSELSQHSPTEIS